MIRDEVVSHNVEQKEENVQKNRKRVEPQSINEIRAVSPRLGRHQPDVVNVDDLGIMLDEDLFKRLGTLEEGKTRAYESTGDGRAWEEEIAYVRREQQVRRIRRDNHGEYVRKSEEEFARLEASLPAGDFDNTAFVYAATGGRPRWN